MVAPPAPPPDPPAATSGIDRLKVIGGLVALGGMKIGTDGTQKAIQAQQQEATKAQIFALHVAPADAAQAMAHAQSLIESQKAPSK